MDKLPRIPSPPGSLWREFRARVAPFVAFASVLVVTVVLWRDYQGPASIIGEVESHHARLEAPVGGRVVRLRIHLMDRVTQGQSLGALVGVDAGAYDAAVALSRARLANLKEALAASTLGDDARRPLAVKLTELEARLDQSLSQRTFLETEAAADEKPGVLADGTLDKPQAKTAAEPGVAAPPSSDSSPLERAIALEARAIDSLEARLAPVPLLAPRDGWVSSIKRHDHEIVSMGETILVVSASSSDRIVAYVRQPLRSPPSPQAEVEVHSRAWRRESARGRILKVGLQFEPIAAELLGGRVGGRQTGAGEELGLPILVTIPPGLDLLPGELVDLRLIE